MDELGDKSQSDTKEIDAGSTDSTFTDKPLTKGVFSKNAQELQPTKQESRLDKVVKVQSFDTTRLYVAQWLVYALWWCFAASIVWLVGVVASIMIMGVETASFTGNTLAFPMISTAMSLLAALAVDFFYSRYEPLRKEKGGQVLQVVYSVIFGLTIVGGLVALTYALCGRAFGADELSDDRSIALITAGVAVVVYGAIFTRILFPHIKKWLRYLVWGVALVGTVILLIIVLGGPAGKARDVRDDALLESAAPAIADKVNTYATKNNKLPNSLADLDFSNKSYSYYGSSRDAKEAIKQGVIRYTTTAKSDSNTYSYSTKAYAYKLCMTFKTDQTSGAYKSTYGVDDTTPVTRPNTSEHGKGEKCYDLVTSTSPYGPVYPTVYDEQTIGTGASSATSSNKSTSATTRSN